MAGVPVHAAARHGAETLDGKFIQVHCGGIALSEIKVFVDDDRQPFDVTWVDANYYGGGGSGTPACTEPRRGGARSHHAPRTPPPPPPPPPPRSPPRRRPSRYPRCVCVCVPHRAVPPTAATPAHPTRHPPQTYDQGDDAGTVVTQVPAGTEPPYVPPSDGACANNPNPTLSNCQYECSSTLN